MAPWRFNIRMGSYYKRQKGEGGPRHVTRAPWLYHTTLPDLLPSIREQGLRPLRDVASRLARDAAEKAAADAGTELDPAFVHFYAAEELLRIVLLTREVALLRVQTRALDPAYLTRDPNTVLDLLRSLGAHGSFTRGQVMQRLRIPGDTMLDIERRLGGRAAAGALELLAPFVEVVAAHAWEGAPLHGNYRYAGIVPGGALHLLLELPAELATVTSMAQALATPLGLDSRRWAPLRTADLAAAARGLGRTEFPADPA